MTAFTFPLAAIIVPYKRMAGAFNGLFFIENMHHFKICNIHLLQQASSPASPLLLELPSKQEKLLCMMPAC